MSTYLSPIVSSGDSTPIEQQELARPQATAATTTASSPSQLDQQLEYPTRELKISQRGVSPGPIAAAAQRPPPKSAAILSSGGGGGQKSIRSMGNSMMLDESSESELESHSDSDASDKLERGGHRNRLRSVAAKNNPFCSKPSKSNVTNSLNSRQRQQEAARLSCVTSQSAGVSSKGNLCLADKLLSMTTTTAAAARQQDIPTTTTTTTTAENMNCKSKRSSSSASSSSLINCSDNEMNTSNSNNHHNHHHHHNHNQHHQFHQRVLRSANKVACDSGEKLNKKFNQMLQSIPMVPLVATTSVMTILILCFVLLLTSDSLPMRATANVHPQDGATTSGGIRQQQQSNNLEDDNEQNNQAAASQVRSSEDLIAGSSGGGGGGGGLEPLRLTPDGADASLRPRDLREPQMMMMQSLVEGNTKSELDLKREIISELLLARNHQQPAVGVAAATTAAAASRPTSPSSHNRGGVPSAARSRLSQSARLVKSKRGPSETSAGENAGLFESLGAMLFGASAARQQRNPRPSDAGNQLDDDDEAGQVQLGEPVAAALAASSEQDAELDGGPATPRAHEAAPHRPARLRSSALELELSPSESRDVLSVYEQPAAQSRARSHGAGKHQRAASNRHQHVATEQQQQQQQSAGGANHERPFDVAQIQCNNTEEGFERFACPTPDLFDRYKCIEDRLFCDGYHDCPNGEDEDRISCMYYRLFVSHIDILTNTFLTWMKSQNRQQTSGNGQHHHQPMQHQQQRIGSMGGPLQRSFF